MDIGFAVVYLCIQADCSDCAKSLSRKKSAYFCFLGAMQGFKRLFWFLAINASVLALGVLLLELCFGAWLGDEQFNRLNLIKGRKHIFDISRLYPAASSSIVYSRDKYGLRGKFTEPAQIDILTVGGSTTDQRYIADGETWQDVLEDRFKAAGDNYVLGNAGVDGQSSVGHIMDFKWWFPYVPALKPQYVLFYVGINDLEKPQGDAFDNLLVGGGDGSFLSELISKSALVYLFRTLWGTWSALFIKQIGHRAIDFSKQRWTRRGVQADYSFMQEHLLAYAQRLRILADLTQQMGAEAIFVSQPSRRYRISSEGLEGIEEEYMYSGKPANGIDYYQMLKRINGVTASVAEEKGCLFVDLGSFEAWRDADFYDYAHMTPQGTARVGALLFEALHGKLAVR